MGDCFSKKEKIKTISIISVELTKDNVIIVDTNYNKYKMSYSLYSKYEDSVRPNRKMTIKYKRIDILNIEFIDKPKQRNDCTIEFVNWMVDY